MKQKTSVRTAAAVRLANLKFWWFTASSFAIWLVLASLFFSVVRAEAIILPLVNVPNVVVVTRCLEYLFFPASHDFVGNLALLAFLAYAYEVCFPRKKFRYLVTLTLLAAMLIAACFRDLMGLVQVIHVSPFFAAFVIVKILKSLRLPILSP